MRTLITWQPDDIDGTETLIADLDGGQIATIERSKAEDPDDIMFVYARISERGSETAYLIRLGRIRSITPDTEYKVRVKDGQVIKDER